jgi:hypothetical protein
LRRALRQKRYEQFKKWRGNARKHLSELFSLVHRSCTVKDLVGILSTRMHEEFDILMKRSS